MTDSNSRRLQWTLAVALVFGAVLSGCATTAPAVDGQQGTAAAGGDAALVCGPQSPRDISVAGGTNTIPVPGDGTRPGRLCNVHFHRPAEHTGIGPCPAIAGGGGPQGVCSPRGLDADEAVRVGDEIEVHWVYTSCATPAEPQPGLGNCVCGSQEGPDPMVLMVFGQKYVVAPDDQPGAANALREPSTDLARYAGSTTGPGFSSGAPDDALPCSPAKVQWAVARQCEALQISALGTWCEDNPWNEDHAHGIRQVITREDWLSPYTP